MYIGSSPTIGNFQVCDAISVVNGQASYTMQVSGVNATPQSANHMLVSLNGILQAPNSSFTVSGSTITFASNLVTGDVIDFIQILGDVLDLGVPSDNTVSLAKLTATGTKSSSTFLRGDNTFASAGGVMTPAFESYDESIQTFSDETWTKLDVATENFDTNNNFDNSTMRFTPTVSGKYFVYAKSDCDASGYLDLRSAEIVFYKNGTIATYTKSRFMQGNTSSDGGTVASPFISAIFDLNGSSDYVEVYAYINAHDNSNVSAMNTIFGGYKIIE